MNKIKISSICLLIILLGCFSTFANPVVNMNGKNVMVSGQLDLSKLSMEEVRQVQNYYLIKKGYAIETEKIGPIGQYWEQRLNHER